MTHTSRSTDLRPRVASALELANRIAHGSLSSYELVREGFERIDVRNPPLNAFVALRRHEALEEAIVVDRKVREGLPLGVFEGVPCSIKESFFVRDMPNTAGLLSRKHHISAHDGITVQRLKKSGAIPLGVTNISELLMWVESDNPVYGRCNNPYDISRTAGGSSGGEGVAVAAGMVPFGLGADTGGSIRLPAFFNGVFGHKPSEGLVPSEGQWPGPTGESARFCCPGPLSARAEDLLPMLASLVDAEGKQALQSDAQAVKIARGNLSGLRVHSWEPSIYPSVSRELLDIQRKAKHALRLDGAATPPTDLSAELADFKWAPFLWAFELRRTNEASFRDLLQNGRERHRLRLQWLKLLARRSEHTAPALALASLEKSLGTSRLELHWVRAKLEKLRAALDSLLDDGVLLVPSYTRTAPKHGRPMITFLDFGYAALFNVLGYPATQVPLGRGARGLPLGIQIIGKHGRDAQTIAVARRLEEHFGGYQPPAF